MSLQSFGPEIWICEGPVLSFAGGFRYSTRMVVMRLSSNDLFIWSPVAISDQLRAEIDALGPVRHIVSPNLLHHLYLGEWVTAYPDARLYAPPGLRRRRKDLTFDADLHDTPDPAWSADIDLALVHGSFVMTEAVFFHRPSGTVIFADLIQNFRRDWFKGWRGLVARLDGLTAPNPGAPREWRATFFRRRNARASIRRILDWPIKQVVIAHGDLPQNDAHDFVRRAFGWLLGPDKK